MRTSGYLGGNADREARGRAHAREPVRATTAPATARRPRILALAAALLLVAGVVVGLAAGQVRLGGPAVGAPARAARPAGDSAGTSRAGSPAAVPGPWRGTCRAGGVDCLPDEDFAGGDAPTAAPRGWTGTCRAGDIACLPDEDDAAGATPGAAP